jgi:hypothetical protein
MYIPVKEFKFPEPGPEHFRITCKNHPTAEYSTKNPYLRGLHFLKGADDIGPFTECPCPFEDLVVVV